MLTDPVRLAQLSTPELESLLARPGLDPAEASAAQAELQRRWREELINDSNAPSPPLREPVAPAPAPPDREKESGGKNKVVASPPLKPAPQPGSGPAPQPQAQMSGCGMLILVAVVVVIVAAIMERSGGAGGGSSTASQTSTTCVTKHITCTQFYAAPVGTSCTCVDPGADHVDYGHIR